MWSFARSYALTMCIKDVVYGSTVDCLEMNAASEFENLASNMRTRNDAEVLVMYLWRFFMANAPRHVSQISQIPQSSAIFDEKTPTMSDRNAMIAAAPSDDAFVKDFSVYLQLQCEGTPDELRQALAQTIQVNSQNNQKIASLEQELRDCKEAITKLEWEAQERDESNTNPGSKQDAFWLKKAQNFQEQFSAAEREWRRTEAMLKDQIQYLWTTLTDVWQQQEDREQFFKEENAVLRGDLRRSEQELKNIFKRTVVPMEQKVLHTTEELANVVRQLTIAQDQNLTLHQNVIALDRYRLNIENSLKCANCANVGDYIRAVCRACGQLTLCKTCIESMPEKFCTKCMNTWKDTDSFFFAKNPIMFP